jgi:hypothetical protein
MVRIGILLTCPDFERQKNELFRYKKSIPDEFPWNKYMPKDNIMKRRWRLSKVGSNWGVPTDRAIGCFVEHAYKNKDVEVDYIGWEDMTMARLKKNDLNFLLIYDLLEVFHMDASKKKIRWNEIRNCLRKAPNVFPPWHYQEFCCSKSAYYRYLTQQNVDILPTLTMTTSEYKRLGHKQAVQKVQDHAKSEGWPRLIAKPEYGQTALDTKFFWPYEGERFDKHVRLCMKKYPGIVFQRAIKGFGCRKEDAEVRMLYCGDTYQYSVIACDNFSYSPEAARDKHKLAKIPVGLLKRRSRQVLKKLPKLVMPNGVRLPRFITRIDMGFNIDGELRPFVNEIEYCPSFFIETASVESGSKLIRSVGHQMVRIAKLYKKRSGSGHKLSHKLSRSRWLKRRRES